MNNLNKYPEGFEIVAGDKSFELLADSAQEKSDWMNAIKQALSNINSPQTPRTPAEGELPPSDSKELHPTGSPIPSPQKPRKDTLRRAVSISKLFSFLSSLHSCSSSSLLLFLTSISSSPAKRQ